MDRKDDTMNLEAIRAMLNDVPESSGEFDLDSIIAEVSGGAPAKPKAAPAPREMPPAAPEAPKARPAAPEAPKAAPKARPAAAEMPEAPKAAPKARPAAAETPEAPKAAPKARAARVAPPAEGGEESPAAPRETRAAARERRAEEKAARRARRAAPAQDAQDEAVQPPVQEERLSRKELRARRRAAEEQEEAEEIELRDPAQAARAFKRRAQGLTVRSIFVLLLAAAAAYLSLAPTIELLPLPTALDAIENPGIGIGVLILLQFAAIFLGVDVFGMGFYSLFHGTPDRATLVSFAVLAALLHGASIVVFDNTAGVPVPYLAVSILLLYASMREERGRYAARARAYQAVCSAEQPMAVYSLYDREDDACRAVKGALHEDKAFLIEMERPDTVDRFSMIYVPVALAASVIFALVASLAQGEPLRFFWVFSAVLSVSAPLGLLCAFGAGYKNVSRRLLGIGAAIAGARQANLLRGTEEVVMTENDLFPSGAISLEALQNMGRLSDEQLLGCAAALASAAGLTVGRVLTEAAQERYGVSYAARNVRFVEDGLTGEVGTSRIVFGTAALMVKMGQRIRAGQTEPDTVSAYVVVDDTLAGAVLLRYQPTKSTYQAMRLTRRMHMNIALAVRDFNISPAMIESQFDLRRGFADQPSPDSTLRILRQDYTEGAAPAAILTREGAGPFLQVLRCADKLAGAVRSALTLGAFAGICGMLIVFYLAFQNTVDALPVQNLLLYQLIWYIPAFIITQQTH